MSIVLRPGTAADAAACGAICYEAFKSVCTAHGFPPDLPSADVAHELLSTRLAHPRVYSVVAEVDGRIAGSNFLDERSIISGVGPVTVDPAGQNHGVGGHLMQDRRGRRARPRRPGGGEPGRRRPPDAGRPGPPGPPAGCRRAPASGQFPQPLALPLYQAGFPNPRTHVDPAGQAARAEVPGL